MALQQQAQQAPQAPAGALNQMAQKGPDASTVEAEQVIAPQAQQGFDVTREMENLAKGRQELDAQIRKMQESLARRTQLSVEPNWAAFTEAVSRPTKTGSAFEALGSGMGAFSKSEQDQLGRQTDIDKMNLELMAKRQQLQQQMAGQSLLNTMYGQPGTQTPMNAPSAPVGGGAPITAGAAPITQGVATAPPGYSQFRPITERDLMMARAIDPEAEKFLMELRKTQIEAQKAAAAGFTKIKSPFDQEEYNVPIEVANQFFNVAREAATSGDEQKLIKFLAENGMYAGKKTAAGTYEQPRTKEEKEVDLTRLKTAAEKEAAGQAADAAQLRANFSVANDIEYAAKQQAKYAESNAKFFDLLQDTTVKQAIARAVDKGKVGPFEIDAKDFAAALNKLDPKERIAAQMFLQQNAFLQLMYAKQMAKGEGAISDNERRIFGQLGALPSDSALAIRLKSEQVIEKAKFNKELYKAWVDFKKSEKSTDYDQFLTSNYYSNVLNNYNARLDKIMEDNAQLLSTAPKAAPAKPVAQPAPASSSSIPPGYIRDPQTGVIRKKREGE